MVSEASTTLSEAFKREALAHLNNLRPPEEQVSPDAWLEDVIPTLSTREKQRIYEAYDAGRLSEGAAHVLLGDALYAVEEAIEEMRHEIETSAALAPTTPNTVHADATEYQS